MTSQQCITAQPRTRSTSRRTGSYFGGRNRLRPVPAKVPVVSRALKKSKGERKNALESSRLTNHSITFSWSATFGRENKQQQRHHPSRPPGADQHGVDSSFTSRDVVVLRPYYQRIDDDVFNEAKWHPPRFVAVGPAGPVHDPDLIVAIFNHIFRHP
uniref:(northern house mosquito) hypothetical protein n=1 Tax=Culex pipiens TaxID=7175 RepID=A0A8D8B5K3_CULPI